MSAELHCYLILIVIGFLPSEVWRWLGIALGRGLDEQSEIILWVRAVATALIAGVIARIVLIPPGALAGVPLSVRRSEEHTSELQSRRDLVCRLLLEKKK